MGARSMATTRARARRRSLVVVTAIAVTGAFTFVGATGASAANARPRVKPPAFCSNVSTIDFGDTPQVGTISAAGQADCYTFRAAPGRRVRVRVVETDGTLVADTQIFNANGTPTCPASTDTEQTCRLVPGRFKTIVVRDAAGTNTGGYTISTQMTDRALGCTHPRFGHTQQGALTAAGSVNCYHFVGNAGDHVRLRVVATDGTAVANTELLNPNGTTLCGPSAAIDQTCRLNNGGTHTILVRDLDGPNTGGYTLYLQRLNTPEGCTELDIHGAAIAGAIGTPGDVACYTFAAIGKRKMHATVTETTGAIDATSEVVKPNGTLFCGPSAEPNLDCFLDPTGEYTLLVGDRVGPNTGTFTVAVAYGPSA